MVRKNGRNHGEVFTQRNVVQYILDEAGYISFNNLSEVSILEPASGKGAFAHEIIRRLFESSKKYKFSFLDALINNVRLLELDPSACKALRESVDSMVKSLTKKQVKFSSKVCIQADFLSYEFPSTFNCVVGNPPYIRHELIDEDSKKLYRKNYKTFRHRADLYIPFFEQSLKLLKKKGILSFICSNRWLNNQYGEGLRELISTQYHLVKLLNIEKASPFDESVIAYPCITTIANDQTYTHTLVCEDHSKEINFDRLVFRRVAAPKNGSWQNLFLSYSLDHDALLGLIEQDFEIGIGVATGADKVFIRHQKELNGIERSRVIPLVRSIDLKNNKFNWNGHYVINPYEENALCDLRKYPHLHTYLNENRDVLLKRHTAQKTPDKWYKTIDKIKPELQYKPKLLLPDLTGNKVLFIDKGDYYPHHNIYYITGQSIDALKILAGILMSDFVKKQMSQIGIRMNGGLPRFQAQLLKKLKTPNIKLIKAGDRKRLIDAYENHDLNSINTIINKYCQDHGIY